MDAKYVRSEIQKLYIVLIYSCIIELKSLQNIVMINFKKYFYCSNNQVWN